MDISQREARGLYSPPNGNDPEILPDKWKSSPDAETTIDLVELTDEELNALGWKGPIQMPPLPGTSYYTHSYEWNRETRSYDAFELPFKTVDYNLFWEYLISTSAYSVIKEYASQSLKVNTITTEFIALLTDAKNGRAKVDAIQSVLSEIVQNVSFTEEQFAEIQNIFLNSGMFTTYTLS